MGQPYSTLEKAAIQKSMEVSDLLVQGQLQQIYDRFDAALQAQVCFAELEDVLAGYTAKASIGDVIETRFITLGQRPMMMTVHSWNDQGLALYAAFNTDGTIQDIVITPLSQKPLDPTTYLDSPVTFHLPFQGLCYTAWGGTDELYNYHVTVPFQQYAYDFLVWKDGST